MNEHMLAHALEWLEHKSKPLFVVAALIAYGFEIYFLTLSISPLENLNEFLIKALVALTTPFSIILLQEILELVAKISESNLLSARHQFEIVALVIVRSFFKSFSKVNESVQKGLFSENVQEAVVKVFAILILMVLVFFFRRMANSDYLYWYSEQGKRSNLYKQALVVVLVFFALGYQIISGPQPDSHAIHSIDNQAVASTDLHVVAAVDSRTEPSASYADQPDILSTYFDVFGFVSLVFTGLIVIEALFLILSILKGDFPRLMLESGMVIALIFARFPLFVSNTLSYSLSVLGVAFATGALYLYYRISMWAQEAGYYPRRDEVQQESQGEF